MAKKLSFNDLPAAVEKILETLSAEGSGHTALPELVQRLSLLEKKIDHLQRTVSPEKAVMDTRSVCRILKLRPKAVRDLAESGLLPYRTEGRKTLYYEDGVVKYFMTQPAWSSAVAKPVPLEPAPAEPAFADIVSGERRRIDINTASVILDRSPGAIYQQTSTNNIPFHKDGKKLYFYEDELREWLKNHPPLKRRQKSDMP